MTRRDCPECGAPLVPTADACPFCGHRVVEPEPPRAEALESSAGIRATASVASAHAQEGRPPAWEERSRHGVAVAFWLTWRDSVFRPVPFFRELPVRGGKRSALVYAVILAVIGLAFHAYWEVIEGIIASEPGALGLMSLEGALVGAVWMMLLVATYVGALLVGAAAVHLSLWLVGGAGSGYEGTFRALAYAAGPAAFTVIPFLGPLVGSVWLPVLAVIALREVQRTTTLRVLAALGLLLVILGGTLVGSLLLVGVVVSSRGAVGG